MLPHNGNSGQLGMMCTEAVAILFFVQLFHCGLGTNIQIPQCGYDANCQYISKDFKYIRPTPLNIEDPDTAYATIEDRFHGFAAGKLKWKSTTGFEETFNTAEGNFSNVNYADVSWPNKHMEKLGGFIYKARDDSATLEVVKRSFKYMLNANYEFEDVNWWWYLIGNPLKVWEGLFYLRDKISYDTLLKPLLDKFWRNTLEGDVWEMECRQDRNTGGNFGSRAIIALVDHILRKDLDVFIKELQARMTEELVERRGFMGNSFRHDGCLHQHNILVRSQDENGTGIEILNQIYNTNYGKELLMQLSNVVWVLHGTSYDLGPDIREAIFDAFFECQQWLFRGHVVEPSSLGRFIDSGKRLNKDGSLYGILRPLEYFKKMNYRKDEVESAIQRYYNVFPADADVLIGNRNFFLSDLMAHQRKTFMVNLRMMSRRCDRPEVTTSQNIYGYFLGDGFMTLVLDTTEMGAIDNDVFQSFDWARIPGVTGPYYEPGTVPKYKTHSENLMHIFNDHDFVGGVSDKNVGMAAMVLARPPIQLRAKKSFLMLDDVILAMGSDIHALNGYDQSRTVTTTMTQIIYDQTYSGKNGDTGSDTIEGHETIDREWSSDLSADTNFWIHHREVAYISLKSDGKLMASAKEQEHTRKNSIFSAWIDHGTSPNYATYAYVVFPNISLADTIAYAQAPKVEVLKLDGDRHAACDRTTKMQGEALFKAARVSIKSCLDLAFTSAEISTDKPCLLLAKMITDSTECSTMHKLTIGQPTNPSTLRISVADPTHLEATVDVAFIKDGTAYVQMVTLPEDTKRGDSINICFFF